MALRRRDFISVFEENEKSEATTVSHPAGMNPLRSVSSLIPQT
jgi:hypothetical protein